MMTSFFIENQTLKGEICLPPSKSQSLRAILFGSLANGITKINSYLDSPDTHAMIQACRSFGAEFTVHPSSLIIKGTKGIISESKSILDAGNSGIVLRFCSAVASLQEKPVVITGDDSLCRQRPMDPLIQGLLQLGVSAISIRGNGFAPLLVQGPITGKAATINGEDSQPVSALLIACAFAKEPIDLYVKNPGEKPWVALTLDWFDRLGIPYKNTDYHHYRIFGNAQYSGFEYSVPGDLSSAAFPIAAALITNSSITVQNSDMSDPQGDKELISVFQKMGACIEINENSLHVFKGSSLSGATIDINRMIDALPILAVVACFAEGETRIINGAVAKQKECNRIKCVAAELRKMGGLIQETNDGLIIKKAALKGATVDSYQDHRMAMSMAVAALGASGKTQINDIACIAKTFPTFVKDFNALGAGIEVCA